MERCLIRVLNVKAEELEGQDVQCSVSVGPASVFSGGKGSQFKKEWCDLHNGSLEVLMDIGEAPSKEPWSVHVKFRNRGSSFKPGSDLTLDEVIPLPATRVDQKPYPGFWGCRGICATLEVLRLVPGSAREGLFGSICNEIEHHRGWRPSDSDQETGQKTQVDRLCTSVQELCNSSTALPELENVGLFLLDAMVGFGRLDAAEALMVQGVEPTVETVCLAEQAGFVDIAHRLVERLRPRVAGTKAKDPGLQLVWALRQKLPGLADRILEHSPNSIRNLPCKPGSPAARMAYEIRALRVLAALIKRGDPAPAPIRELLVIALDDENVALAQACLSKSQDLGVDDVVRICLGHERSDGRQLRRAPTVMVREALEARWRVRNSQRCNSSFEEPALLALAIANGSQEDPVECSICFEPLHSAGPSVFLNESGRRSCPHFVCQTCASHVYEAKRNSLDLVVANLGLDLDDLILAPRSQGCPMCRQKFSTTARLPDPTVDPCTFFQYACLPEASAGGEANELRLAEKAAYDALCAVLPVDLCSFKEKFTDTLWPAWTSGTQARTAGLTEADFAAPGGMLSWVGDQLIEFKVEQLRGQPPQLVTNPEAWFQHFDYDGDGLLSKNEVLRGIVKMANMEMPPEARTSSSQCRHDSVLRLRDVLDSIWNAARWQHGVPMKEFVGSEGLASKLLMELPEESRRVSTCSAGTSTTNESISVEEALTKARAADLAEQQKSKEAKQKCQRSGSPLQSAAWGSNARSHMEDREFSLVRHCHSTLGGPRLSGSAPDASKEDEDTTLDEQTSQEAVTIQGVRRTRAGANPARDSHVLLARTH